MTNISRRSFLAAAGAALAGAAFDPERALWTPGKKTISIPAQPPARLINLWIDGKPIGFARSVSISCEALYSDDPPYPIRAEYGDRTFTFILEDRGVVLHPESTALWRFNDVPGDVTFLPRGPRIVL